MQARMETAADRYRRRKKETQTLHEVVCACGESWKCRRAEKGFWLTSGMLPTSMLDMVAKLAKGTVTDEAELLKTLADSEIINSIEFASKVVRYTAVEPRIVETPTEPNDLAYEEVDTCCYATLRDWQMKGGKEAEGLENFRT